MKKLLFLLGLFSTTSAEVTIMTFNTNFMWDGRGEEDGQVSFARKGDSIAADSHMVDLANIIIKHNPDFVNLVEVEGEDAVNRLNQVFLPNLGYQVNFIQGKDSYTGQDVALLSKQPPIDSLYRDDRYGISGAFSKGVSKHYIAKFEIDGRSIAFIGVHFLSNPSSLKRRYEREAQADVIRRASLKLIEEGYEVIVLGDINDYDSDPDSQDKNSCQTNSRTFDLLKTLAPNTPSDDLINVSKFIPINNRYTAWHDGNNNNTVDESEFCSLDHILISKSLANFVSSATIDNKSYSPALVSDHFPVIVKLNFNNTPVEDITARYVYKRSTYTELVFRSRRRIGVSLAGWSVRNKDTSIQIGSSTRRSRWYYRFRISSDQIFKTPGDTIDFVNPEGEVTQRFSYTDPLSVNRYHRVSLIKPAAELGFEQFSEEPGAINVYFNKTVQKDSAYTNNVANELINLEDRLIHRINSAQTRIDFACYEINLPRIAEALVEQAANGIQIRVIADAKVEDEDHKERYENMRILLEKMLRGKDGQVGTADDIYVFADSPVFAVEGDSLRTARGLPIPITDLDTVTLNISNRDVTGYLLAGGEKKDSEKYYAPNSQMHNKFAVADNWVFTGSWNYTTTGLYGDDENQKYGILGGNQQHVLELHDSTLADIYKIEFNEMWGSSSLTPNEDSANFHGRKSDNTPHHLVIGGVPVDVYFSPGDNAVGKVRELVDSTADSTVYFSIFAWSDQELLNTLKNKWEGSVEDRVGDTTGFDIKGVFDKSFWNHWWSASIDMSGTTKTHLGTKNKNIRWAHPAPIHKSAEDRKLHSKSMLIDPNTNSNPAVVVGSTNWSDNGNLINDENMLIIHSDKIVNQFYQEFVERYQVAEQYASE